MTLVILYVIPQVKTNPDRGSFTNGFRLETVSHLPDYACLIQNPINLFCFFVVVIFKTEKRPGTGQNESMSIR